MEVRAGLTGPAGALTECLAAPGTARDVCRLLAAVSLRIQPDRCVAHGRETRKDTALAKYLLKLYVTGKTPRAERAIANLRQICETDLRGEYELEIIDVLEHPQLAEDEKILATPTLIKQLPLPLRRVIGDLSDRDRVLLGLDVWQRGTSAETDSE